MGGHWSRDGGRVIGGGPRGYTFTELLGEGAFGSVYKATMPASLRGHKTEGKTVCAVKVLALDDRHIFGITSEVSDGKKACTVSLAYTYSMA